MGNSWLTHHNAIQWQSSDAADHSASLQNCTQSHKVLKPSVIGRCSKVQKRACAQKLDWAKNEPGPSRPRPKKDPPKAQAKAGPGSKGPGPEWTQEQASFRKPHFTKNMTEVLRSSSQTNHRKVLKWFEVLREKGLNKRREVFWSLTICFQVARKKFKEVGLR